jgi:ABC-type antimicrobial peptide transport system ATPase subunit
MRDLQEFKISHPEQRMTRIIDTINKIMNAPEFQQFQVTMTASTHQLEGKVNYPP